MPLRQPPPTVSPPSGRAGVDPDHVSGSIANDRARIPPQVRHHQFAELPVRYGPGTARFENLGENFPVRGSAVRPGRPPDSKATGPVHSGHSVMVENSCPPHLLASATGWRECCRPVRRPPPTPAPTISADRSLPLRRQFRQVHAGMASRRGEYDRPAPCLWPQEP